MAVRPIERQSVVSLISLLAITVTGYAATFYFAHTLGAAILGGYFLFLAYYGLIDLIGDGGFGGAAVKRISEGHEKNAFYSAFLVLRIGLLIVSITVLFLIQPFLVDLSSAGLFLPLLIALLTGVFYSSVSVGVYGAGKVGIVKGGEFLTYFTRIAIQIVAVFLGYGLGGLFGGFIAGMVAGGILFWWCLDLRFTWFQRWHIRSLLTFSFWIFLTAGGNLVFSFSDVILIGYFLTNADVGIYRTALQLTSAATFTASAIQPVLYPKISGWSAMGATDHIRKAVARAFSYSLLLAIPVCAGGWILGDVLLYHLYGAEFQAGSGALFILLAMQIISVLMSLQIMCLNAIDQPKVSFKITAVSAAVNILLGIGLVPVLGIAGAAVATLVAIALNAFLGYLSLRNRIAVSFEWRTIAHITLAAGVMTGAVALLNQVIPASNPFILLGTVSVGAIIYFTLLFRLDTEMYRDVRDLTHQFGLPWPHLLDKYYT